MIVDRYLASEIARPLSIGVSLLAIIFVGYSTARHLADAAEGLLLASTVGQLIVLKTIISLEILLPTALYFSILVATGRLHRDSEMVAFQASGVSEYRILAAVLRFAIPVAILVALLSILGRPWAYEKTYAIEALAESEFDVGSMAANQFISLQDGKYVLFAKKIDYETGALGDVFVQKRELDETVVISARTGFLPDPSSASRQPFLFRDGYIYELDRDSSNDRTTRFSELTVHLQTDESEDKYRRKAVPTVELGQSELPKDIAEYQWRLSTPLATVLLACLAVPLARNDPRQRRATGFLVALVVYILMLSVSNIVRNALEQGHIPEVPGLWLSHIAPLLLLFALMFKPAFSLRRKR